MWRDLVLKFMKVPPMPEPPPGSPPRVFRASPKFLTLKIITWLAGEVVLAIPLAILAFVVSSNRFDIPETPRNVLRIVMIVAWAFYAIQFLWNAAVLKLDFEQRWYMVSDRAIRIREGISVVREKTIALANVQNIALRQGPLQLMLGIADVEVTSAGGGAQQDPKKKSPFEEPMHIAKFRGVDNADAIRDLVSEGVRRQRTAGLGDADEVRHVEASSSATDAAALLLEEARRLRAAVERMT